MLRSYGYALLCAATLALGGPAFAASIYAPWANGPPQDPNFFPISVFWQAPQVVGYSGPYRTEAEAAAAQGINIFLAIGSPWPERFGSDNGELAAIKANGLYLIGGTETPSNENISATSVASVLALANSIGATRNVIGYNAGDEPNCTVGTAQIQASIVNAIKLFDPTRLVLYNHNAWMLNPQYESCLSQEIAALQANSVASFDLYPLTSPWIPPTVGGGDFLSVPHDSLWLQGVAVRGLAHFAAPNQPLWVFVESGGDNAGFSGQANYFGGAVANGSSTLAIVSGRSQFTAAWLGLTVSGSGIPANTTITQVIDPTHARMSRVATGTANTTVTVTGGVYNTDCVATYNICVAQGNRYRPTPIEVNAEVWMSLINGAHGIEYFCHDSSTSSFCLGDYAGGAAAAAAQANLTYINHAVLSFAPVLNAPTIGSCSMDSENFTTGAITTSSSCSNGVITLTTSDPSMPASVMVKKYGSSTYVFVQSSRRSATGAVVTMHIPSLANRPAQIIYNSVKYYQGNQQPVNKMMPLDGNGNLSDALGRFGFDYQVKIYKID